jgi:hypothetical protein
MLHTSTVVQVLLYSLALTALNLALGELLRKTTKSVVPLTRRSFFGSLPVLLLALNQLLAEKQKHFKKEKDSERFF